MPKQKVCFLLHAHLPFALRLGPTLTLEEIWLHQAVNESYLPLLERLEQLPVSPSDGGWLTLSLSPTLLELWAQPDFPDRFRRFMRGGLDAARRQRRSSTTTKAARIAVRHLEQSWEASLATFERYRGDLTGAFARLARSGRIELITTAATHALLPAWSNQPALRKSQLALGIETFRHRTGLVPEGFWLPECAYADGLEIDLAEHGIRYFGLESVGLEAATPPVSPREAAVCPNGLLALARDATLSALVWNPRSGFPGHPDYREFHDDAIHRLAAGDGACFELPSGEHLPAGLKYKAIGRTAAKPWYAPDRAAARLEADSAAFTEAVQAAEPGLHFLPFDAELFGHWWHEGPDWLAATLKRLAADSGMRVCTCREFVAGAAARALPTRPAPSSWGQAGNFSFWINPQTDWIFPLIEAFLGRLNQQKQRCPKEKTRRAALNVAGRLLHLACASDWPFMIRAGTTDELAREQLGQIFRRLEYLLQALEKDQIEPALLAELQAECPAFAETVNAPSGRIGSIL